MSAGSEFVRRLRRVDACAVSDALDKLGLTGVLTGLAQQSGEGRIAGRAITVKLGVGSPPSGAPRHLGTRAVEAADTDSVIVIEQRSGVEAGSWGGLLTLGAKMRGAAGVVADGPVRDIDEARAYGFPIFTHSLTAFTARGRIVELSCGEPIQIGRLTVAAGDYVLADRSAVVFIRPTDIARVLDAAEAIAARESVMAKAIMAGSPISLVMSGDYEHMLSGSVS